MNLIKHKQKELPVFGDMITDFFIDDFFKPVERINKQTIHPPVNIQELEKYFLIDMATPGYEKEDILISLNDNILTISSKSDLDPKETGETKLKYQLKEFSFKQFKRDFTLPENIAVDDIKATYKAGILSIEIPKAVKEVEKPKTIEIA